MIPTKRLLIIGGILSILILLSVLLKLTTDNFVNTQNFVQLENICLMIGIALLVISILDIMSLLKKPDINIQRVTPRALAIDTWTKITLKIRYQLKFAKEVEFFDHLPDGFDYKGLPGSLSLIPGETIDYSYKVKANQRGNAQINQLACNIPSLFGLWKRQYFFAEIQQLKVYPNFAAITQYIHLAVESRTAQLGIRKKQRRGEGQDFHQLREYRESDSMRQIDWKASSRRKQLISREYHDERDQQIIFLLDCGRAMRAQDDKLSHFDHALNAMLLLAYIALKSGDAVGFLSFGGDSRWLMAEKGASAVNRLLNQVYDLQAGTHASDYQMAVQQLQRFQKKRALVVLISNVRDDSLDDLLPGLKLLKQKHLILLANLREQVLDNVMENDIQGFDDALLYAATNQYLKSRREMHERLVKHGVLSLDVTPGELPIHLVNSYFEIKRSGSL